MGQRIRHFDHEEQARAIARAQDAVWRGVVARFEQLKAAQGLRQADLAAALGVSRPQIHEWLSEPRNMTLKAAGRLLLAMDAHAHVEVQAGHDAAAVSTTPNLGASNSGASGRDRRNADAFGPWRLGGLAVLVALISTLAAILAPTEVAARPLKLSSLDRPGEATNLAGQPTILVFWRADCGPCLIELGHLRDLEAASGRTRLALVSLDTAQIARVKLKAMGLAPRHAWRLRDDPAATLSILGGGAPRLPLSAAYTSAGQPCGLRIGLLGANQVRRWARACS